MGHPIRRVLKRVFDLRRWRRSRQDLLSEIEEEFAFHLEMDAAHQASKGASESEALAEAKRLFGDYRRYRDEGAQILWRQARRQARAGFVDQTVQDIRVALRMARRTPLVTAFTVLALALGIGANTAVFSVLHAMLLPPLPFPDADRLVQVQMWEPDRPDAPVDLAAARYFEIRDRATAFERLEAFKMDGFLLEGATRFTTVMGVSNGLFSLLGVEPYLGRLLSPSLDVEQAPAGVNPEMLLSYDLWRDHFGGDSTVVGRTVRMEHWADVDAAKIPRVVVGVLPPDFRSPPLRQRQGLWPTSALAFVPLSEGWWWTKWQWPAFTTIGTLWPGVTLEEARSEAVSIAAEQAAMYGDDPDARFELNRVSALPRVVFGRVLTLLWSTVVAVLLIACLNVACLLLARASVREGEFAVRAALGGDKGRIVRQLLTESAVTALVGASLGLLLAWGGLRTAIALFPGDVFGLKSAGLNGFVLAATLALSLATVLLFGWAPLLVATRASLLDRLKGVRGGGSSVSARLLNGLVAAEVSLVIVLLTSAGLLATSFLRLTRVELGFEPENVLVVKGDIALPEVSKYGAGEGQTPMTSWYERTLEAARELPGVVEVAGFSPSGGPGLPLGRGEYVRVTVEDRHRPGAEDGLAATWANISPGYFKLMDIPALSGRTFTPEDRVGAPLVAVVSESAARKFWPGRNPLGRRLTYGHQDLDNGIFDTSVPLPVLFTVVGVVGDISTTHIAGDQDAMVYMALAQQGFYKDRGLTLLVRTSVDPLALASSVRAAVVAVDPSEVEVQSITTMDQLFSDAVAQPRFYAFLMGVVAVVALVLALSGVYGVLAYLVSVKTQELGIRITLGADRRQILALVLRQGLRPVVVGLALGTALALYTGRFLTRYLFEVTPADPRTLAATALLVLGTGLLACYAPARRASTVDPIESLRDK